MIMDMMMVNIVSPDAGVTASAGSGGAQSSDASAFGEILNAEMSQCAPDETSAQTVESGNSGEEAQIRAPEMDAAAALIVAQFIASDARISADATAAQESGLSLSAQAGVESIPQGAVVVSPNTPVATDGGPYAVGAAAVVEDAATSTAASDSSYTVTNQGAAVSETTGVDISAMDPVLAGENVDMPVSDSITIPLQSEQSVDTGNKPVADSQTTVSSSTDALDPVFRTVVRESLRQTASAGELQEQASPVQASADTNAANQAVQQTQSGPDKAASVVSEVMETTGAPKAVIGENNSAQVQDAGIVEGTASDSKVQDVSQSSGDLAGNDNPTFSFAGGEQVRANSGDTAQAARTQSGTEAYSEVHQRVIDQVVREVKLRRFDQGGEIIMRLDPPELGTMRVHLTQEAGILTGHISASSDQVKSLLQSHLSTLVDALAEAGVKMDSVSVSTGMPSGTFNQESAQNSSQGQFSGSRRRFAAAGASAGVGAIAGSVGAFTSANNVGYSWLA